MPLKFTNAFCRNFDLHNLLHLTRPIYLWFWFISVRVCFYIPSQATEKLNPFAGISSSESFLIIDVPDQARASKLGFLELVKCIFNNARVKNPVFLDAR